MSTAFWVGPPSSPDRIRLGPAAASGAEGVLYRGFVDQEGRDLSLAVKMLQPGHLEQLGEWARRWRQQAELLRRTSVPGLVVVRGGFIGPLPHQKGQADSSTASLYLLMDWIEGVSLDRWAASLQSPQPEGLLAALIPVGAALDVLHSGAATEGTPVLHRDVKPANILVEPGGQTILVDIGSLRGLTESGRRSALAGTPGYIAPEVRRGGQYSAASDRYSLGAVAFFLLTGSEPPPDGDPNELRQALLAAPIVGGRKEIADHVGAMLHEDPECRPVALANWVAQLRSSSLPILQGGGRLPPRAPLRRPPAPLGDTERRHRLRPVRWRRPLVVTIAAVVIVITVPTASLQEGRKPTTSSTARDQSVAGPAPSVAQYLPDTTGVAIAVLLNSFEQGVLLHNSWLLVDIDKGFVHESALPGGPIRLRGNPILRERSIAVVHNKSTNPNGRDSEVRVYPTAMDSEPRVLGSATTIFASLAHDRLWLVDEVDNTTSNSDHTKGTIREVDLTGRTTVSARLYPEQSMPVAAVKGGILLATSQPSVYGTTFSLWDPDTNQVTVVNKEPSLLVDTKANWVAWLDDSGLHVFNTETGLRRTISEPSGELVFSPRGLLSPDARYIAMRLVDSAAVGGPHPRLTQFATDVPLPETWAILDLNSQQLRIIEGSRNTQEYIIRPAWALDSKWFFFSRYVAPPGDPGPGFGFESLIFAYRLGDARPRPLAVVMPKRSYGPLVAFTPTP